jgi:cobalt-precorrin 5A hydrolase/precorrin-3B C17-methyltransferase
MPALPDPSTPTRSLWDEFAPLAAIALTPTAAQLLQRLGAAIPIWVPESLRHQGYGSHGYTGALHAVLAALWSEQRTLIFGLATGAVVRLIAPLLQDKATDPAVLVVDETGQFVISLCGGHQAGADRLTYLVARQLGATPVLTGAAHRAALPGIDVLGIPFGWRRSVGDWTTVAAHIARGEPVQVIQEAGNTLWQNHLPPNHPLIISPNLPHASAQVWITPTQPPDFTNLDLDSVPQVHWHPRVLWLGMGCERGTPKGVIEMAVQNLCHTHQLAPQAIAGIATLDLKADEIGLLEFAQDYSLSIRYFSPEQLQAVPVPNPSTVVAREVGTASVAEAAALLASRDRDQQPGWLRVPKSVFRCSDQPGAVTLAMAQAQQEYTGRKGQLWLVGTGPGALDQMTPAAQGAIGQADAVIGYSLYIDLIRPLFRPGQIIEALPITQEQQRARRAIDLATWGLNVAVISSGDAGIYGMAGLVLEELQRSGWDGVTPGVEVFPGISALQAAASRVGAPLMHDFCAISLSDLLTPWAVIADRLQAAAQADFVTTLYNPKSKTRTEQLKIAQQIFLQHRPAQTPVAVVRSVYRPDEKIWLTHLADLAETPIDMLTIVVIGNRSTRFHQQWMITPRGYLGFEQTVH